MARLSNFKAFRRLPLCGLIQTDHSSHLSFRVMRALSQAYCGVLPCLRAHRIRSPLKASTSQTVRLPPHEPHLCFVDLHVRCVTEKWLKRIGDSKDEALCRPLGFISFDQLRRAVMEWKYVQARITGVPVSIFMMVTSSTSIPDYRNGVSSEIVIH